MDLFGIMDYEASCWNRLHSVQVVLRARVHPPGSGQYRDVAVVWMKMGPTVVVRQPLLENNIETRFRRSADQRRHFGSGPLFAPLDILRQLDVDCFWIELRRLCRAE